MGRLKILTDYSQFHKLSDLNNEFQQCLNAF